MKESWPCSIVNHDFVPVGGSVDDEGKMVQGVVVLGCLVVGVVGVV